MHLALGIYSLISITSEQKVTENNKLLHLGQTFNAEQITSTFLIWPLSFNSESAALGLSSDAESAFKALVS